MHGVLYMWQRWEDLSLLSEVALGSLSLRLLMGLV